MIPMGRLSTTLVYAPFLAPDDVDPPNEFIDYELGGRALNDASEGLQVHTWTASFDSISAGNVSLAAPGFPETVIFTAPGITEISLAFDQNMRPFFAYVQDGQAKFRWYDTVVGTNVITNLNVADQWPRCCMDDKRDMQTSQGTNDIILAYVRAGNLYYRQQRDRFEVEYLLYTGVVGRLVRVGKNIFNRLQFMFEE